MPVKTRSSLGRFESSAPVAETKKDFDDRYPIQKQSIWALLKYLIILLLISPWIFLMMRNRNTLENVSKKITDFYDDNFSCTSQCSCENASTSNISQPGINSF
jgi:hypothetical protein